MTAEAAQIAGETSRARRWDDPSGLAASPIGSMRLPWWCDRLDGDRNASPLFPFDFPKMITFGGWLAGALLWHFAAMWLLVVNGLVYMRSGF